MFKTEFKQLNTPITRMAYSKLLCPKSRVSLSDCSELKVLSFKGRKELTPRFSSLNNVGAITLRPSFGKNIWIILSRSSQVALRNTPFGSLTTMKRSWKWGKNQTLSKAFSLHCQNHPKTTLICQSPSKVTIITPVSNWLLSCARFIISALLAAE